MTTMTTPLRMRPSQLARRLDVAPDVIHSWIRRGVLPADCVEREGRHVFILMDKFADFAQAGGLERSYILRRSMGPTPIVADRPDTSASGVLDHFSEAIRQIGAALNEEKL